MRKLLPYEQIIVEQKDDLSVPDIDMAWTEMEKLLDKDDDDNVIIPPPKTIGCAMWLIPFIVLIGIGIWLWFNNKKNKHISTVKSATDTIAVEKPSDNASTNMGDKNVLIPNTSRHEETIVIKDSIRNKNSVDAIKQDDISINSKPSDKNVSAKLQYGSKDELYRNDNLITTHDEFMDSSFKSANKNQQGNNNGFTKKYTNKKRSGKIKYNANIRGSDKPTDDTNIDLPSKGKTRNRISKNLITNTKQKLVTNDNANNAADSLVTSIWVLGADSSSKKDTTVVVRKPTIDTIAKTIEQQQKDKKRKLSSFYVGVGLGMYQQIPIGGVATNSFNYYGRTNAFSDYLPILVTRLYKKDKWYIQLEGRYGAPQYNKDFTFLNTTSIDSSIGTSSVTIKNKFVLKKSFYHQVPISFHYNIKKNITIGTGIVLNKFYGAIAEKTVSKTSFFANTDSIVSKGILSRKEVPDSNFKSISFQSLFEVQYRWRKLMLGLRYTIGITPYISYVDTQTNSNIIKRHQNLNAFLRYELWNNRRSKK